MRLETLLKDELVARAKSGTDRNQQGEACVGKESGSTAERLTWWKQRSGDPVAHGIRDRVNRRDLTKTTSKRSRN
jgi:hypothetical protein